MREKLFEVVKLLNDSFEENTAIKYLDIFMKYLANTDNKVTKTDAVKAIETIFLDRGADMIKGWAKEYVEEGREEGIKEGKTMLLEAINARYNYIREDIFCFLILNFFWKQFY